MVELLYQCMTKATTAEGNDVRHSLNWMLSRRGVLKVFTDRLECADWVIPYSEIEEAMLFRTRQMFIPCYVLRVKAQGRIFQFGLNPGRFWKGDLPFGVTRGTARLHYSWFSLAIRGTVIVAIAYLLWKRLR